MSYLKKWADGLPSLYSRPARATRQVEGVRKAHLGPRLEIARVLFLVDPAEQFEVRVEVPSLEMSEENKSYVEGAVFGFLDVVMLAEPCAVRDIRLRLVELE